MGQFWVENRSCKQKASMYAAANLVLPALLRSLSARLQKKTTTSVPRPSLSCDACVCWAPQEPFSICFVLFSSPFIAARVGSPHDPPTAWGGARPSGDPYRRIKCEPLPKPRATRAGWGCLTWAYPTGMPRAGQPNGDASRGPTQRGCLMLANQTGMPQEKPFQWLKQAARGFKRQACSTGSAASVFSPTLILYFFWVFFVKLMGVILDFQSQDVSDGGLSRLLFCHPGLHDDCHLESLSLSLVDLTDAHF